MKNIYRSVLVALFFSHNFIYCASSQKNTQSRALICLGDTSYHPITLPPGHEALYPYTSTAKKEGHEIMPFFDSSYKVIAEAIEPSPYSDAERALDLLPAITTKIPLNTLTIPDCEFLLRCQNGAFCKAAATHLERIDAFKRIAYSHFDVLKNNSDESEDLIQTQKKDALYRSIDAARSLTTQRINTMTTLMPLIQAICDEHKIEQKLEELMAERKHLIRSETVKKRCSELCSEKQRISSRKYHAHCLVACAALFIGYLFCSIMSNLPQPS